jgi:hypothetical protein
MHNAIVTHAWALSDSRNDTRFFIDEVELARDQGYQLSRTLMVIWLLTWLRSKPSA